MKLPFVIGAMTALFTGACATGQPASVEERTLSFGCNEIVVVGRVAKGVFEPEVFERHDIPTDLVWAGWISATLKVRRVVKGGVVSPALSVRYFSHTYIRDDRDFMFVLKRTGAGTYVIGGVKLMSFRPLLADRCK